MWNKKNTNYSFQKIIKINRLFENKILFDEYKKNINEMLCSETINNCFNEITNFQNFFNPYNHQKIMIF